MISPGFVGWLVPHANAAARNLRVFAGCWDSGKVVLLALDAEGADEIGVIANYPAYCISCSRHALRVAMTSASDSNVKVFVATAPDVYDEGILGSFTQDPISVQMCAMSPSGDHMALSTNGDADIAFFDRIGGDYLKTAQANNLVHARNNTPAFADERVVVAAATEFLTSSSKYSVFVNEALDREIVTTRDVDLGGNCGSGDGTLAVATMGDFETTDGGAEVIELSGDAVTFEAFGSPPPFREFSTSCSAYDASYFAAANDVLKIYKRTGPGSYTEIYSETLPANASALCCDPTGSIFVVGLAIGSGAPLRVYVRTEDAVAFGYGVITANLPADGSISFAAMGDPAWTPP